MLLLLLLDAALRIRKEKRKKVQKRVVYPELAGPSKHFIVDEGFCINEKSSHIS